MAPRNRATVSGTENTETGNENTEGAGQAVEEDDIFAGLDDLDTLFHDLNNEVDFEDAAATSTDNQLGQPAR